MKKLTFVLLLSSISIVYGQNTADLNGVTIGFGIGPAVSFDKTYDYTLSTDVKHTLKVQPLNKGALVISTVLMFKLKKLAIDQNTNKLVKQDYAYNKRIYDTENDYSSWLNNTGGDNRQKKPDLQKLKNDADESEKVSFKDRLSVNVALNLVNISQDVSFNTKIDGGVGLGYLISEDLQAALFLDISRVSQLRDFIVTNYTNKSIPNGDKTYYTSLDIKDNNLFYDKTISGLSIKLLYSFGSKKPPQAPGH